MNFLDTYDLAGSNTPPRGNESEQTLNEEVNQVIGQIGRFWGGVRRQVGYRETSFLFSE
jgi:hypothetical protein